MASAGADHSHDEDGAISSETSRFVKVNHRFFNETPPDTSWDTDRACQLVRRFFSFS